MMPPIRLVAPYCTRSGGGHRHLPHQSAGDAIGEAHILVVVIHAGVEAEHQQVGIQHGVHLWAGVLVAEHADNGDQHDGNEDIETHHLPAAAGILGMGGDGAGQGPGGKRGDIGQGIIVVISRGRAQIGEGRVVGESGIDRGRGLLVRHHQSNHLLRPYRRHQLVAALGHGNDIVGRIGATIFEDLAQFEDGLGHHLIGHLGAIPHLVDQGIAAKHGAGIVGQKPQQVDQSGFEVDLAVGATQHVVVNDQGPVVDLKNRFAHDSLAADGDNAR